MERVSFNYSTKNIPVASKREYTKQLIDKTEQFLRRMRWKAFHFLNPGQAGEYKTKTEDLRPKNEDPVKIVLKSLKKGSNMILDQSRNKEHQDLQLSTNLTRVFVLYITLPKVQNEDPVKIVLKLLEITRKRLEHDSRPKQKQGATRFAFMNKFDQGLRFVHNPTKSTKRRPRRSRLEIT